ncbi:MAG: insulinase family protein [Bacteroidia bacterium]
MKKLLYIIGMIAIANASLAQKVDRSKRPDPGPAPKIQIGQYEKFELANGLKVFVIENHKLPTISFQLTIDKDPLLEKDKVGLSSMAGDLMSAGTTNRTKEQIDEQIDFMGANFTSYSNGFFASALTKHTDKLLEIATDVLYNSSFPQEELDKMKKRTISGIKSAKTSPDAIMANVSSVLNYGKNHPYGEVQTVEHVENITIDDCKNYVKTYFRPNVSYLVIVGDIKPDKAKALVEKYFAQWEKAEVPTHNYATPQRPKQTEVAFVHKPGAVQSVIEVTHPIDLKPGSPDELVAAVMNQILGGGVFSGRLMQNLRETKAYTYGARSSLSSDELVGSFSAGASVRNEVTDSSVHEFMYELRRIVTEMVTADELNLIKSSMNGSFARSLERPQTIARFALNIERYGLPKDYYDTYLERLSAITIEDIKRVAEKYIYPENANIIIVGNKDIAGTLTRFSTSGKVNMYDINGDLIVEPEIKKELPAGLTAQKVVDDYVYASSMTKNAKELKKKLKATKSINVKMTGEVQGFSMTMTRLQTQGKYYESVEAMGQVFQKKVFNGKTGYQSNMMSGKGDLEGEELEEAKLNANYIPEMLYATNGYKLELKGLETFNGKDVYALDVVSPKGTKTTEYYDVESKMKVYTSSEVDSPEGKFTSEAEYSDYKEVKGFMMPHKVAINVGGQAIDLTVSSIEINGTVDAELFK